MKSKYRSSCHARRWSWCCKICFLFPEKLEMSFTHEIPFFLKKKCCQRIHQFLKQRASLGKYVCESDSIGQLPIYTLGGAYPQGPTPGCTLSLAERGVRSRGNVNTFCPCLHFPVCANESVNSQYKGSQDANLGLTHHSGEGMGVP